MLALKMDESFKPEQAVRFISKQFFIIPNDSKLITMVKSVNLITTYIIKQDQFVSDFIK